MGKILVKGGIPLRGRVKISGAKNASLALLCAAIMAKNKIVLENVPNISDIRVMIEVINSIGASASWEGQETLQIVPPQKLHAGASLFIWLKNCGPPTFYWDQCWPGLDRPR
ncbi:MAG: hypothetical protein RQM92_17065 [Candidatus Syntrophopropionicum ammoniitolerans]